MGAGYEFGRFDGEEPKTLFDKFRRALRRWWPGPRWW